MFGVLTTVVNIVVYFLSAELLHINYLISNALAWFLSVLFAYITNRKYVFESNSQNILKEAGEEQTGKQQLCGQMQSYILEKAVMLEMSIYPFM